MNKVIFSVLFVFISASVVKADQLAWISLDQAKAAIGYLENQKQVILWCACCEDDNKVTINVVSVDYVKVDGGYYQVILKGTDLSGQSVTEELDLAYVHVKVGSTAKCLGKVLGFDCDPCTAPFPWR